MKSTGYFKNHKVKNSVLYLAMAVMTASCTSGTKPEANPVTTPAKDTLTYAYKATYSSDITVPGNPLIGQKVLKIWKMFETMKIQEMKPYFADTVQYNDASGMHFHGSIMQLLSYAKKDVDGL